MHACIHASTPKMHQNIRIVLDGLHSQKKVRALWVGRGFRTCTVHLSQPGREVHQLFIVLVEREDTPTFWCYPFTSADSIRLEETASPFGANLSVRFRRFDSIGKNRQSVATNIVKTIQRLCQ